MQSEKALAIVTRGTDWSETSRITTLFTREFGKIRALAKGGRRLKSNFDVAFDLLTVCEVVFIRKASGLELLTEARMNEQFPALRKNLPALYAGYYVAELLAEGLQDYDPHPVLFDAALAILRALGRTAVFYPEREGSTGAEEEGAVREGEGAPVSQAAGADSPVELGPEVNGARSVERTAPLRTEAGGGKGSLLATVSAFELVWLQELGYSPRLDACATCGRERLSPTARAFFSPLAGGVLCPECGPAVADRRMVSGDALLCIRDLTARGAETALPDETRAEVRQVLGYAVSCVLGRRPRMLNYVDAR
ncbi:DNA repair protein RecO [Gemmata obscuriglobus]|uniref:DNA repair protein RecO n=1 Tax=Gemmata obscuriglobus TaxID=114 RepID=UPI00016C364E|nr:DNA repair protein RecO [Gemmata obscuriglobus]QEG28754.1 DNA repair protein RecO [Gemmata obscuriglobus]VTS07071.1 dna repair protein : DNA repair protein RecO OS=Pirellula staleyi (strain ATCC 27377 / DSM 6068 / ICPB 4128) GN=recO PE=3 SV=1: RecO_N: RecO_C: RecO_C [Gemmata obscuriglobus UQM 2246]